MPLSPEKRLLAIWPTLIRKSSTVPKGSVQTRHSCPTDKWFPKVFLPGMLVLVSPEALKVVSAVFVAGLVLCCSSKKTDPAAPSAAGAGGGLAGRGSSTGGSKVGAGGAEPSVAGMANAGGGGTPQGGAPTGGASAAGGASAPTSDAGSAENMAGAAGAQDSDYCGDRPGLTFCDSFEGHSGGATQAQGSWQPSVNGDGTLVIDENIAHSGSRSLKVHGSGFSTFLVLSGDAALPPPGDALFVRAYMRLAEAMHAGHNTFIVADLNSAPGTGNAFRLGEMNAMLMYTVTGDTHGALANDNYYTDQLPGAALEAEEWACVEVLLDPQTPEIRVWLDGTEIPDLHHSDWALDAYDALRFGFEKYAGPVSDVWYDDIAVGSARLGCE